MFTLIMFLPRVHGLCENFGDSLSVEIIIIVGASSVREAGDRHRPLVKHIPHGMFPYRLMHVNVAGLVCQQSTLAELGRVIF